MFDLFYVYEINGQIFMQRHNNCFASHYLLKRHGMLRAGYTYSKLSTITFFQVYREILQGKHISKCCVK